MNLPPPFLSRMSRELGAEFPEFLKAYDQSPARGCKVNTLKISSRELLKLDPCLFCEKPEPVPWARDAFYNPPEKAGGNILHFAGLYYLQEPSAMCAAPMLDVHPKDRVLDLCAAPGGKSVQLACDLGSEGILISNEINYPRAKILSQNIERMGITNAAVTCAEPSRLAEAFPGYFNKILVDAPCSGEGMFKKEESAAPQWSLENVHFCARRQAEILDEAVKMLCPGGKMVYSTCTFSGEENEIQVENFLKRHPDFRLLNMEKLYPHKVRGEGHFAALFERTEGGCKAPKSCPILKNQAARRAFGQFQSDFLEELPEGEITTLGDGRMYLLGEKFPDFSHIRLLRLGLELGEWDGKLFRPAHALAVAAGVKFKKRVELKADEAQSYLRGESLPCNLEGWCVTSYAQYPLGLGKCSFGTLKNHYPKALRMIAK